MDQLPRLGKRELICLLSFTCNYVVFVWRGFLFLWVLGMGYVILLWHSLSLPYNYFTCTAWTIVSFLLFWLDTSSFSFLTVSVSPWPLLMPNRLPMSSHERLIPCIPPLANGTASSTSSMNDPQFWWARTQYSQPPQGKSSGRTPDTNASHKPSSVHILLSESAFPCLRPLLCLSTILYWESSSIHLASCPCGSRKFVSHIKLAWSVLTINGLPSK